MSDYDEIAEQYNKYIEEAIPKERFETEITKFARITDPTGWSVLDVGCGSGVQCQFFKDRFPAIGPITGVDASKELIAIARKRHNGAGITYVVADFHDLPFADNSFMFVNSRYALHYSTDIPRALNELARVTARGGQLFLYVTHPIFELFLKSSRDYRAPETVVFEPSYQKDSHEKLLVRHPSHTLSEYINGIAAAGLVIDSLEERFGSHAHDKDHTIPTALLMRLHKST